MPKDYDKSKDKLLKEVKVKNDKEGFSIKVLSYDGHEPRISVQRHYKGRDDEWHAGKDRIRLSFRLLRWLVENNATLDAAYASWDAPKGSEKSSGAGSGDDPF